MLLLCVFYPYFFHHFLHKTCPAPFRFLPSKQNTVDLVKTLRICCLPEPHNSADTVDFFPTNVLPFPLLWLAGRGYSPPGARDVTQMAKNECPASTGKLPQIPATTPGRKRAFHNSRVASQLGTSWCISTRKLHFSVTGASHLLRLLNSLCFGGWFYMKKLLLFLV